MSKIVRTSIIIFGILLGGILVLLFFINTSINSRVKGFIENRLPSHIQVAYDDLDIAAFDGTVTISNPRVSIANQTEQGVHTTVQATSFIVKNISYWDYLVKNEIHIEDVKLFGADITYHKDRFKTAKKSERKPLAKLYKPIIVDEVSIANASFRLYDKSKDSLAIEIKNATVEIDNIRVDTLTLSRKLPIDYDDFEAKAQGIFAKAGPYENLNIKSADIKKKEATFDSVALKTKYSRTQISKVVKKERDHIDLLSKSVTLKGLDFGFTDDTLFTNAKTLALQDPKLAMYRDKIALDDPTQKPLYSKALRNLNFALAVDEVVVQNGTIIYTEKIKAENNGGVISFSNVEVKAQHVGNQYGTNNTTVAVDAIFMKTTPLHVDWSFNVANTSDAFTFKGSLGKLPSDDLNTFTKPNLNVAFSGMTEQTYFTISGDNTASQIDMRMKYEDFQVEILRKNGKGKNKIVSAIANLFIKKNSTGNGSVYREGSASATRDKTKSIFNYIWLNIRSALLTTLTAKSNNKGKRRKNR